VQLRRSAKKNGGGGRVKVLENEKRDLVKSLTDLNHHGAGNRMPVFRSVVDGLGNFNDAAAISELLPVISRWLSIPTASSAASCVSFLGIITFPFVQTINLVNANEAGLMMYSYRAVSYSLPAWVFDRPTPLGSQRIKSNLQRGPITPGAHSLKDYDKVWRETSQSVVRHINQLCERNNIEKAALKQLFKAAVSGRPCQLCLSILKSYEPKMQHTVKPIWVSNYKVLYPN